MDGEGRFQEESWERPEGGGGRSRVMKAGQVFEQGGVNFSEVQGEELPPSILNQRPEAKGHPWFAIGTSMVLHPRSPWIPTVHLNYRYFERGPCGGSAVGRTSPLLPLPGGCQALSSHSENGLRRHRSGRNPVAQTLVR